MAYDRLELFKKAQLLITDKTLYFMEDVIAFLPCSKSTFYEYFPDGSDELDNLKTLLEENRVNTKVAMRKKWNDSENATLQMALMKLICNDNERKKLAINYNDHTSDGQKINPIFKVEIVEEKPTNESDSSI